MMLVAVLDKCGVSRILVPIYNCKTNKIQRRLPKIQKIQKHQEILLNAQSRF